MDATDREAVHACAVVRRIDVAIAVEVQVVHVEIVRRSRPIVAECAGILVELANEVAVI